VLFFFSSRRRHTRFSRDWSSDVCSSDLYSVMNVMQPVGKIIKDLRLKRGLSQEELAEKINARFGTSLNKGMISKWENGIGDPRLETARHLAVFFGVSLDYLLGIEPPRSEERRVGKER